MMLICIKQHLSNIWSSVYENVKQHWGWVVKSVAYKKKACSQVTMPSIVGHAYMYDKNYMPCLKIKNICIGKNNAKTYKKQICNKKINWIKIDFSYGQNFTKKNFIGEIFWGGRAIFWGQFSWGAILRGAIF